MIRPGASSLNPGGTGRRTPLLPPFCELHMSALLASGFTLISSSAIPRRLTNSIPSGRTERKLSAERSISHSPWLTVSITPPSRPVDSIMVIFGGTSCRSSHSAAESPASPPPIMTMCCSLFNCLTMHSTSTRQDAPSKLASYCSLFRTTWRITTLAHLS